MNIKELVPVISILLSIRIAEYAMKKYKEQKDVEVTKKQKSRKQTKKYIITAPSILKVSIGTGTLMVWLYAWLYDGRRCDETAWLGNQW